MTFSPRSLCCLEPALPSHCPFPPHQHRMGTTNSPPKKAPTNFWRFTGDLTLCGLLVCSGHDGGDVFVWTLSHSTTLQPSPSQKGGDGDTRTHTSSGLTCTAGCLPSLLLGELSPVACCSRNWRATWRACKRDTAGWAGGRLPSSSSLLQAHSPSSSPEQRPDAGLAGLGLGGV